MARLFPWSRNRDWSQPLTVGDLRSDPLGVFEAKPEAAVGDPQHFGQEEAEAKAISITITGSRSSHICMYFVSMSLYNLDTAVPRRGNVPTDIDDAMQNHKNICFFLPHYYWRYFGGNKEYLQILGNLKKAWLVVMDRAPAYHNFSFMLLFKCNFVKWKEALKM